MNKFSVKQATKISADKTVVGMAAKKLRKENTDCLDKLLPMPEKKKILISIYSCLLITLKDVLYGTKPMVFTFIKILDNV
jgi:hypothetical protein